MYHTDKDADRFKERIKWQSMRWSGLKIQGWSPAKGKEASASHCLSLVSLGPANAGSSFLYQRFLAFLKFVLPLVWEQCLTIFRSFPTPCYPY